MKLKTIWTTFGLSFRERLRRTVDLFAMQVAFKMPDRVRMWATIVSINEVAARPEFNRKAIGSITVDDLLSKVD